MITMHEDNNCEICGKRSGCGTVILWITGFVVAVCIAAAVYHEVTMHGAPEIKVDTATENPVIDTTLDNHSQIQDDANAFVPPIRFLEEDSSLFVMDIYSYKDTVFVKFKSKVVWEISESGMAIVVDSVGFKAAVEWKKNQIIKEYSVTL